MKSLTAVSIVLLSALVAPASAAPATLIEAVKAGDRAAVTRLLAAKADVGATEADGTTALHWAVRADDEQMTALLVRAGANAKAANRYGVTPLTLAAKTGNAAIVELLVRAGADPNTASPEGETVLMTAARSGSVAAVKALLARGANPNAKESWLEQTALMWAAADNHAAIVSVLVENGADINARAKAMTGPPRLARQQGVAAQASHSNFPRGGFTPLLFAAQLGAIDAVGALAAAGADLNLPDPDGITPLAMAIINGNYDAAALLVNKGANVNATDRVGRSPLFFAADMHTVEWLFSRRVPRPTGDLDSMDTVKLLLDKGANVNARLTGRPFILHHNATGNRTIAEGATAFMKAATTSDVALMKILLERGADPSIPTRNNTTALMAAAGLNWVDISSLGTEDASIDAITLLLDRGVDINAQNDLGETAVHGAAQRGADKVIRFLASRGAKVDVKNEEGRTPLDEAVGQANEANDDNVRRPERKSTQALLRELMAGAKP